MGAYNKTKKNDDDDYKNTFNEWFTDYSSTIGDKEPCCDERKRSDDGDGVP